MGIFFFTSASRLSLEPAQLAIQWLPAIKRPDREADRSHPSSAEVKYERRYTSTPPYVFLASCLVVAF